MKLTLESKRFRAVLKAVTLARSTDLTREPLRHVLFEIDAEGMLTVCATDGHRIHCATRKTAYGPGRYLLTPAKLDEVTALLALACKAKAQDFTFEVTPERDTSVSFPDYSRVIPKATGLQLWKRDTANGYDVQVEHEPRALGIFVANPAYMVDVYEAAALVGEKRPVRLELGLTAGDAPRVSVEVPDDWKFVGAVMPMRE